MFRNHGSMSVKKRRAPTQKIHNLYICPCSLQTHVIASLENTSGAEKTHTTNRGEHPEGIEFVYYSLLVF